MNKLQSPQYAKQNIINNYKVNYTADHQSSSDVELFLNNALDQYEKIVRADCVCDRDKQDEAVENMVKWEREASKEKEVCCVCGEPAELKCHACENYYCEKHYKTTVLTGNCCSENEKIYDSQY